jgi:glycosyltransferase involved in cell wall biosynthesis
MRAAAAVYLLGAVAVLGLADLYEFTWRYQLPGLVLLPLAGVLGFTTLIWRPAPVPFPHPDDDIAIDAFRSEFGDDEGDLPVLPPVAVVIAAYNEAKGIGAVLDGMPETVHGLGVAPIVVIDGGTDDTGAIARKHGAYVCEMPRNRGQGAALRLGYYLARTGGAEYIVTTDADGQYDIAALPDLMQPLFDDEADFVTGSRRLGVDQSRDSVRRTGVWVFAVIVSVLTGKRVTDTSFGFRAMRAEITGNVVLDQPQYQSSELLISVLSHGYRVAELPMTMRVRNQGRSKKGNNLIYGLRYARVVFSTWSRERSARSGVTNTNRSSNTYLATNVTAYEPK